METSRGKIEFNTLINCAGENALGIAERLGAPVEEYEDMPILGKYAKSIRPVSDSFKHMVYPLPEKGNFTLGVHSTLTTDGHVKIGPTGSGKWATTSPFQYAKLLMSE